MTLQEAIHRYIRSHRDDHIEKLREYLRQPGISAENIGDCSPVGKIGV